MKTVLIIAKGFAEVVKGAEYSSAQSVAALNDLCKLVKKNVSTKVWSRFEDWCLKATDLEIADRAVQLLEG